MTTFTVLSDSSLSQDKPLTQSIVRALRDNPLAIAEGDATAPIIVGLNPLSVLTASASAALTFTNLSTTYDYWEFELLDLKPSATGNKLQMQLSTNGGSSWGTAIDLISNTTGGGEGIIGNVTLSQPASALANKIYKYETLNGTNSPIVYSAFGGATGSSTPYNAVRFLFSTGNITSGKIVQRPRRKA